MAYLLTVVLYVWIMVRNVKWRKHIENIAMSMKSLCLWSGVPDIYITPAVQTLRAGDHLMMRCMEADGQHVLFEWSKVDGTLSSAVHVDSHSGVLEVASFSADDAGQYQCRATNQAGSSDAFAEITLAGISPFVTRIWHVDILYSTTILWPFVWDYSGEAVPEETFAHLHLSCSSAIFFSFLHLPRFLHIDIWYVLNCFQCKLCWIKLFDFLKYVCINISFSVQLIISVKVDRSINSLGTGPGALPKFGLVTPVTLPLLPKNGIMRINRYWELCHIPKLLGYCVVVRWATKYDIWSTSKYLYFKPEMYYNLWWLELCYRPLWKRLRCLSVPLIGSFPPSAGWIQIDDATTSNSI